MPTCAREQTHHRGADRVSKTRLWINCYRGVPLRPIPELDAWWRENWQEQVEQARRGTVTLETECQKCRAAYFCQAWREAVEARNS